MNRGGAALETTDMGLSGYGRWTALLKRNHAVNKDQTAV